ncbi:hypothetical protein FHG87_002069 [Trinorchestia longiramus]|nr:hypothetical protein FHG87_002069 [Trinorchestia longiramus]
MSCYTCMTQAKTADGTINPAARVLSSYCGSWGFSLNGQNPALTCRLYRSSSSCCFTFIGASEMGPCSSTPSRMFYCFLKISPQAENGYKRFLWVTLPVNRHSISVFVLCSCWSPGWWAESECHYTCQKPIWSLLEGSSSTNQLHLPEACLEPFLEGSTSTNQPCIKDLRLSCVLNELLVERDSVFSVEVVSLRRELEDERKLKRGKIVVGVRSKKKVDGDVNDGIKCVCEMTGVE